MNIKTNKLKDSNWDSIDSLEIIEVPYQKCMLDNQLNDGLLLLYTRLFSFKEYHIVIEALL